MSRTLRLFRVDYPPDSDKQALVFVGRLWVSPDAAALLYPGDDGLQSVDIEIGDDAHMLEQCFRLMKLKTPLYAYEGNTLVDCVGLEGQ